MFFLTAAGLRLLHGLASEGDTTRDLHTPRVYREVTGRRRRGRERGGRKEREEGEGGGRREGEEGGRGRREEGGGGGGR